MKYQINLRELLEILKKDKWLIILGTIGITAVFFLCSELFVQPKYASSVQLAGVPNVTNTNEINANILSVTTFKDFAKSTVVLKTVMDDLGKEASTLDDLKQSIEVKQSPDSQIFSIQAIANNGKLAEKIADRTAKAFKKQAKDVLKNDSIAIVSPAGTDTRKVSPNLKVTLVFGILCGGIITMIVAMSRDFFDGTIKSEKYIEEAFGIIPIGSVSEIDPKAINRVKRLQKNDSIASKRKMRGTMNEQFEK